MEVTALHVCELLAICLEIEASAIADDATRENTEGWDSVIHLSLLGLLEDNHPGILDLFPQLAEAMSISEIVTICNAV